MGNRESAEQSHIASFNNKFKNQQRICNTYQEDLTYINTYNVTMSRFDQYGHLYAITYHICPKCQQATIIHATRAANLQPGAAEPEMKSQ